MAMQHKRQAPGRDIHRHFSLAPARSHTKPPSNPQSAPAPNPLQDRAQARNATFLAMIESGGGAAGEAKPETVPDECDE